MGLIASVVAARKNMEPLVKDKAVKTNQYSFKYASLQAVLDVVVPALLEQGVLLTQSVQSDAQNAWVTTILHGGDNETLESGQLVLKHGGTAQDLGKCITSLRRYQLISFLGLAAEEDEGVGGGGTPQHYQGTRNGPETSRGVPGASDQGAGTPKATANVQPSPLHGQVPGAAGLELLRRAARKGQELATLGATPELQALILRIRNDDAKDGEPMATTVAPGKKVSMYSFYKSALESVVGTGNGEMVMSFLYGRMVSLDSPPSVNTEFLFREVAEGRHAKALGEARTLVAK